MSMKWYFKFHKATGLGPHHQIQGLISTNLIRLMGHTSTGRGCVPSFRHTSSLRGPFSLALTLLGGIRFIEWRLMHPFLGESRRGLRHFWECRARLGYGAAPGPTLRKALCRTRPVGGTADKYHQIQLSVIFRTLVSGGHLTPPQRSSRRILKPQPTKHQIIDKMISICLKYTVQESQQTLTIKDILS